MAPSLRVLTYNLHKGFSFANRRFTLPAMRDAIHTLDPDVVFLQEVQGEHHYWSTVHPHWPEESHHEFIGKDRWPHCIYGKNARYKSGHHGNAILSKYPFSFWENMDVSIHRFSRRSVLHGVIRPENAKEDIHIICIHFGLFKSEREKQLQQLSQRIAEHVPSGAPLIIAGDFNDWQKLAKTYMEGELALKEIFHTLHDRYAKTYPVWQPILSVDRIYCRNLTPRNAEILKTAPWKTLSDHAALYGELELP